MTCDADLAEKTNLITNDGITIKDLYSELAIQFKQYCDELNVTLFTSTADICTRKLIKASYMPKMYGKTIIAVADDIENDHFKRQISRKEAYILAKLLFDFWDTLFPKATLLMKLFKSLATLYSILDKPCYLDNSLIAIVQDYKRVEKCVVSVYSANNTKKRVTLSRESCERDPLKSGRSVTANCIHSLDAFTAQKVISEFYSDSERKGAPFYTVHDCFVTSPLFAELLPSMYIKSMLELGSPIECVNSYVKRNLFPNQEDLNDSNNLKLPTFLHSYILPGRVIQQTATIWTKVAVSSSRLY